MAVDPEVRRLCLSVLLPGFAGPTPPTWLLDALAEGLGGVVLFGSNVGDGSAVGELTAQLRAAAGRDVVVATDEEGGDVTRLDTVRGSSSPGAAALGHLDDVGATEHAYASIGARLAGAGITLDLAPVADVNVDPRNPVIGVRSFGADPDLVARHVAAAVRGLQAEGVAACAKHFPGHGATSADSHHEVATLHRSREELDAVELVPFRAAVEAGAGAVMTGHLLVPALDPDNLTTVSAPITTGLLRDELGFTGAVVTDALEMRALADTLGMERGFVAALAAGADTIETGALEYPELIDTVPTAVQRALDDGTLERSRLEEASRRTTALTTRFAPFPGRSGVETGTPKVQSAGWSGCLEVVGELPRLVRPLVLECRPPDGMASGQLPWSLAEPLARYLPGTEARSVRSADDRFVAALRRDTPRRAPHGGQEGGGRDVVLVVRDPVRHDWQLQLLDLATVVVDVGWPVELPGAAPVLRTRGVAPVLLEAAAQRLAKG